jgi:hypothetical protein
MKKFSFLFAAILFTGDFDSFDQTANTAHPGSGTSFTETESEAGKTLTFTDAYGQTKTLEVGEGVMEVFSDGKFTGYQKVPKWVMSQSNEVTAVSGSVEAAQ